MNTEQILQLEPSPEADRAFAEVLLGWLRDGDGCYVADPGPHHVYFTNDTANRSVCDCELFAPTTGNDGKGDPAAWWLGVERLHELGCGVTVYCKGGLFDVEVSQRFNFIERDQNPAIAVLRAGVLALKAMGEIE